MNEKQRATVYFGRERNNRILQGRSNTWDSAAIRVVRDLVVFGAGLQK